MFFRKIFLLFLLTATLTTSFAQSGKEAETLKKDLNYLASDELKGREAGTEDEVKAAKYIAARFREIGLKPKGEDGYYQHFTFMEALSEEERKKEEKDSLLRKCRNVIGYIDNGSEKTIVIGAHYDHLGWGEHSSRHTGEKAIHNGADDNASGTSAILLLAQRMKAKKEAEFNYLFIAFSAEEKGLIGSRYFVNHPLVPLSGISCMLNLDMVGRLSRKEELTLTGVGTSPAWEQILARVELKGAEVARDGSGLGRSDHTHFYLKEIPVLNFFTGEHEDYHKPGDDADKIDYQGILNVVDFVAAIIDALDETESIAFSHTENSDKRKEWAEPRKAPKYKVTLGVMPDYTYGGEGMRIESVIADRPAANAGLEDGDVVKQLGDVKVIDLQTYMKALAHFSSGDKTTVHFERDGVAMKAEVEF